MRLPDFILIGAMKCGTSTLHEQLGFRDGLYMSDPKEPNFFSDDVEYDRGIETYARLFSGARAAQLCGESSTHYTKLPTYPRTVERMRSSLARVKLVYVMRDPLERMVSQYIHEWSERTVRGSIERAVREHDRLIAYSEYARQLRPYLDCYGAESILPVFFERMLADPDRELERVCRFIGDPTPEKVTWRSIPARNVSSERLRRSPLRDALLGLTPVRRVRSALPRSLRDRIKRYWQMQARPELSEKLRSELETRLDADLAQLGSWLGLSLRSRDWRAQVLGHAPAEWTAPPPRHT
jgi:hypothetical protein